MEKSKAIGQKVKQSHYSPCDTIVQAEMFLTAEMLLD
jgi:hypothetical protein